jgi:hypothetical protein
LVAGEKSHVMTPRGCCRRENRGGLTVKRPNDTVPTNFRRETPLAAMVAVVVGNYSDGFAQALREQSMARRSMVGWAGARENWGGEVPQ